MIKILFQYHHRLSCRRLKFRYTNVEHLSNDSSSMVLKLDVFVEIRESTPRKIGWGVRSAFQLKLLAYLRPQNLRFSPCQRDYEDRVLIKYSKVQPTWAEQTF